MLYGQRVRLRAIERNDLPTFVRWFNDPEVRQFLLMYEPLSMAQEERWFEGHLQRKDYLLAIEARLGDEWVHVGNCGLHDIDWKNRGCTLGIVLGEKAFWGQGLGTDTVRTLVGFAFSELNLHRVELEVFDYNTRAQRCYEKAGFVREGVRRDALYRAGRYHDAVLMSILQGEPLLQDQGSP